MFIAVGILFFVLGLVNLVDMLAQHRGDFLVLPLGRMRLVVVGWLAVIGVDAAAGLVFESSWPSWPWRLELNAACFTTWFAFSIWRRHRQQDSGAPAMAAQLGAAADRASRGS